LKNPAKMKAGAPVARGNFAQGMIDSATMENSPTGKGGYPAQRRGEGREESNFLGSRGQMRERRTEAYGLSPDERQSSSPNKSRNLTSSVHVHNQQSKPDSVSISDMVVACFRKKMAERGGSNGIHAFCRMFSDGSRRKLNLAELQSNLRDFGLTMDEKCLGLLIGACDRKGLGSQTVDDFLAAVRGSVSSSRRRVIDEAFCSLDRSGGGVLSVRDIQGSFNAKKHPDVASGRLAEDQALANFFAQFDMAERNGSVTRDEFHQYYKNVSASIDDDNYFDAMMKSVWRLKR